MGTVNSIEFMDKLYKKIDLRIQILWYMKHL